MNLTSQTTQAVADGNWSFLKPLQTGTYKLKVKGDINATSTIEINGNQYNGPVGWNYKTTYILYVKWNKIKQEFEWLHKGRNPFFMV